MADKRVATGESYKTTHNASVGPGRDRIGEAAVTKLRRNDLSGHVEHKRGDPLGNCNRLPTFVCAARAAIPAVMRLGQDLARDA